MINFTSEFIKQINWFRIKESRSEKRICILTAPKSSLVPRLVVLRDSEVI